MGVRLLNWPRSTENHVTQSRIKFIKAQYLFKCCSLTEFMCLTIPFQWTEIGGKSEIANVRKQMECSPIICNNKPPLFKDIQEVRCVESLFDVFIHKGIYKKVSPWYAAFQLAW